MRQALPLSFALAVSLCAPALAQDPAQWADKPNVTLTGGVGVVFMEGNEYVVEGDTMVSRLIWQSTAPVLTTGLGVVTPEGWTLKANAAVSVGGDSMMEDYDWIDFDYNGPFEVGQGMDEWTHRSQHPNTTLDHYLAASIAIGHDFAVSESVTVNPNIGLKYTDVKWTGRDGTYIYSQGGFRDSEGSFEGPGIVYEQTWPVAFLGLDASIAQGDWTFGLSGQVGVTMNAHDKDQHLMRDLVFFDDFGIAPVLHAGVSAAYAFNDKTSLNLAASVDKMFYGRGDTLMEYSNGNFAGYFADGAAGEFQSLTATAGLLGKF